MSRAVNAPQKIRAASQSNAVQSKSNMVMSSTSGDRTENNRVVLVSLMEGDLLLLNHLLCSLLILPLSPRLLGALAEKCRAFAKALHYKEMEFDDARSKKTGANPVTVVENLIHINNQLHQHEAAVGILTYSQQNLNVQLKDSWYEKLQRWDDALKAYTLKTSESSSLDNTLGQLRCLAALARWEELSALCKDKWTSAEPDARLQISLVAAAVSIAGVSSRIQKAY